MAIIRIRCGDEVRTHTQHFRGALARAIVAFANGTADYAEIEDAQHDIFATITKSDRKAQTRYNEPVETLVYSNSNAHPTSSIHDNNYVAYATAIYELMLSETKRIEIYDPIHGTYCVLKVTMCSYSRHVYEEEQQ